MADYVLELFSEEIPARMQRPAAQRLKDAALGSLKAASVSYEELEAFVTPRRLTLCISGLPEKLADQTVERKGPKIDAPEKAIEGFCRSTGLAKDELDIRTIGKDRYYFAVKESKGAPVSEFLAEAANEWIHGMSWPKSMRWGSGSARWVRPLRSILSVLDGHIVPVSFAGIHASNQTYGHRFLAPDAIQVKDIASYKDALKHAYVVLCSHERADIILTKAKELAQKANLTLREDEGLLEEVSGLVEWPVPMLGSFDESFLKLPEEVLETSMRSHQKYFCLESSDGSLAPAFILVTHLDEKRAKKHVVSGNERVLRARLSDGVFFWEQDNKVPLENHIDALDGVIFHAELGSVADKVARIQALAKWLTVWVPHSSLLEVERAAALCKTDLVTQMVGEFPELQGVMGRYYALAQKEDPSVCQAMRDHYAPQGPSDACPTDPVSVAIAIADKMDSLAGLFAIEERPTGSKDPYALRRAALGVLRLILENKLRLPLTLLCEKALAQYPASMFKEPDSEGNKKAARKDACIQALVHFFGERLKFALKDKGYRHDIIKAVFDSGREDDVTRLTDRVHSLSAMLESDDGEHLFAAYKRAANLLKAEKGSEFKGRIDHVLLKNPAEKQLASELEKAKESVKDSIKDEDYTAAMRTLSELRSSVDAFFEGVRVHAEEPDIRHNRLLLLAEFKSLVHNVANFDVIESASSNEQSRLAA